MSNKIRIRNLKLRVVTMNKIQNQGQNEAQNEFQNKKLE